MLLKRSQLQIPHLPTVTIDKHQRATLDELADRSHVPLMKVLAIATRICGRNIRYYSEIGVSEFDKIVEELKRKRKVD